MFRLRRGRRRGEVRRASSQADVSGGRALPGDTREHHDSGSRRIARRSSRGGGPRGHHQAPRAGSRVLHEPACDADGPACPEGTREPGPISSNDPNVPVRLCAGRRARDPARAVRKTGRPPGPPGQEWAGEPMGRRSGGGSVPQPAHGAHREGHRRGGGLRW